MRRETKRLLSLLLALAMVISLMPVIALSAAAEDASYILADGIKLGKTYVIVADGQYAMTSRQEGPALRSYAGGATTTLASAPVEIVDGAITSTVTDDMLWTVVESTAPAAYDGVEQYFLQDADGNYLRRGSGSSGQGAQLLAEAELFSTIRYNTWSFCPYEGEDAVYAMYANSERAYGTDYPFYVYGNETSFDSPGRAQRSESDPFAFMGNDDCSRITLYEIGGGGSTTAIDFADPADNGKYAIVGETAASQTDDGLVIKTTRTAIEPTGGMSSNGAEDLIEVPVSGNWTATLQFAFDPSASMAFYQFFGFFASEGDDYQNMAGIRGGNKAMQDFLRLDGEITADTDISSAPGLASAGEYWYQIVKDGESYTCLRSDDGGEFTEMFSFEATGIDADRLIIDAYSGMIEGYTFTLKTLTIEAAGGACQHTYVETEAAPTCTERGCIEHTCSKCGRTYKSDYVDPLGHDFGEYVKTKDFTETERGELLSHCSRCDATKTRPIAAGNEKPHKDEILFISDVHSAKRAENGFHNLRALFGLLKQEDNFIPEVVSGGGDYIESSTHEDADWPHCYEVLHDIIYEGAPDAFQALGSGNHEWEWSKQSEEMIEKLLGQPRVGNSYNSDNFAIFHIGAHMNGDGQEDFMDADIEKLHQFLDTQVGNGKIIFVQTHWPLHYAYNWAWRTTKNAGKMIDLLNGYADKMDISFVWGHNHHQDPYRHLFLSRNDVLQISETEYRKIKFNYFNAGCLNETAAEQDAGPMGSDYGPGYCLETKIDGSKLVLDYVRITGAYPDPTQAKLDHNADLLYVPDISDTRESHCEIQLLRFGDCEHNYVKSHTAATCTEWGKDVFVCSKCDVSYYDEVDEPLGHDWDEGVITIAPTETTPGVRTFHCSRCDETKTKRERRVGSTLPEDIDFTTADSYGKQYEILGETSAEQTENGLVIKTTRNAVEDCKGQNSGEQATTPEDMIKVSVQDDWIATLNFVFDTASAVNGYYQFFGFFAAKGDDFQNMAGIRGGDKALQDFLRLDGEITADTDLASAPGLSTKGNYWIRLEKVGDTYTCFRSDDGETFTEMFSYEQTGIEADSLLIDAYTGMTAGYAFTLKSLTFEDVGEPLFRFDDVQDEAAYYFDPVYWAYNHDPQITTGTSKTLFSPNNNCSRAEIVTFLWRAAGEPEPKDGKNPFTDVPDGQYYTKAVLWAVEQGITKGTGGDKFNPKRVCSRSEIVTFLWRFASEPEAKDGKNPFSDVSADAFYTEAVLWAVEQGITNGTSTGGGMTFSPKKNCTRAESVTLLYRAMKDE